MSKNARRTTTLLAATVLAAVAFAAIVLAPSPAQAEPRSQQTGPRELRQCDVAFTRYQDS